MNRLCNWLAARLSEASTWRSLLRLTAVGSATAPDDNALHVALVALVAAELVGVLFPDRAKRGRKYLKDSQDAP